MYVYIGLKTAFYTVRHLDSTASYLPTDLPLGFFHSWPSLYSDTSANEDNSIRNHIR